MVMPPFSLAFSTEESPVVQVQNQVVELALPTRVGSGAPLASAMATLRTGSRTIHELRNSRGRSRSLDFMVRGWLVFAAV